MVRSPPAFNDWNSPLIEVYEFTRLTTLVRREANAIVKWIYCITPVEVWKKSKDATVFEDIESQCYYLTEHFRDTYLDEHSSDYASLEITKTFHTMAETICEKQRLYFSKYAK